MAIEATEQVQAAPDAPIGFYNEVETDRKVRELTTRMLDLEVEKSSQQAKINQTKNEIKELQIEIRGLIQKSREGVVQGVLPLDTTCAELPIETITLDDEALAALADDDEEQEADDEPGISAAIDEARCDDNDPDDEPDASDPLPPAPQLDIRGRVIGMLHEGLSDEAIARATDCTLNTVARIKASLERV